MRLRSAAARKGARVRQRIAEHRPFAADVARDSEYGPEGPRWGAAPVEGPKTIREILDRIKAHQGRPS